MNERILISFSTKQDCRKAYRLINAGVMHNYSLSCDKCDPAATLILMSFARSYISSVEQPYIQSWEQLVMSFEIGSATK